MALKLAFYFEVGSFLAAHGEQNEYFSVLMETTCVESIWELQIALSVPQITQA